MNDDLISRQVAIDAAKKLLDYYGTNDILKEFADHTAEQFMNRVPSAQPTVDAVPVRHGKWLWLDGVRCSQCNYKLAATGLPSYCPNCGARMDEE